MEGERRQSKRVKRIPKLRSFELPFVYLEMGERREALVKVRLCGRCEGKLTWKPDKERRVKEEMFDEESEDDSEEELKRGSVKSGDRRGEPRRSPSRSRSPRRRQRSRSPIQRDRRLI